MISYSNILFVFNKIKNKCHNKNKLMKFIRYKNCYLIDILEKDVKIALANSKKGYMQPCNIFHLEEQVKEALKLLLK